MPERAFGSDRVAEPLLQFLELRKAAFYSPRPDDLVIHTHVEDTAGARHERHFTELLLKRRQQLLRRPAGAQQPAALRAVLDFYAGCAVHSTHPGPQASDDLRMRGKAMRLVLREDFLSVDDDVEHAAVARDDLGLQPELTLNRGRQTGGLWLVVSTDAIGDGDVHTVTMINPRFLAGTWRVARADEDDLVVEMSVALYGDAAAAMGITPSRVRATLGTLRSEPVRGRALVLDSRGTLAGFCLLASFWSNELGGEVCVIDELYLKEDWRGFGHATALVETLKTDRSMWPARPVAFELEVSPGNPDARRLYERLGFRDKHNATMRLALEG